MSLDLPGAVLCIGVTGHRLAGLAPAARAAIATRLAAILSEIESLRARIERDHAGRFGGGGALRVYSMLASGSDSMAAAAALQGGYDLRAILPFPEVRYREDFQPGGEQEDLSRFLAAAKTVTVLPDDADRPAAYERGGRVLVKSSDLLLAVWDGQPGRGRGGTAEILQYALENGTPALVVNAADPDDHYLLWPDWLRDRCRSLRLADADRLDAAVHLDSLLTGLLAPPPDDDGLSEQALLQSDTPYRFARVEYPLLLALLGAGPWRQVDPRLGGGWTEPDALWRAVLAARGLGDEDRVSPFLASYGRADHLADYFARTWRGSFVAKYFGAAVLAVGTGVFGILAQSGRPALVALSGVINCAVLADGVLSHHFQWRGRWLKFRYLAERLRWLRPYDLLGLPSDAAFIHGATERLGWCNWYVQRMARMVQTASVTYDDAVIAAAARAFREHELLGQAAYHRRFADRSTIVDRRLKLAAIASFAMMPLVILGWLIRVLVAGHFGSTMPVVVAAVMFPAIGAAVTAVRAQANLDGSAARSQRLADRLTRLAELLESEAPAYDLLVAVMDDAARAAGRETERWTAGVKHMHVIRFD
jgi:hypothetical protein